MTRPDAQVAQCLARLRTAEFSAFRQYIDALYLEALKDSSSLVDEVQVRRAQGRASAYERLASELREGGNILQKMKK